MRRAVVERRANGAWRARRLIVVRLVRDVKVADGAGGWRITGEDVLPEQEFRIAATARQHDQTSTTTEGEQQGGDWLLIGKPEADVKKGDRLRHAGKWWRVKFVDPNRVWRTSAAIVEHGDAA